MSEESGKGCVFCCFFRLGRCRLKKKEVFDDECCGVFLPYKVKQNSY